MTREEAINKLVNARYADEFQGDEELTEAHLMAIKALEQEPKTDRIEYGTDGNAYKLWISNGKEYEPKTGHWSRKTKVDAYDIAGVKTWGIKCQCDRCDFTTIVVEDFGYYKYCPNCGAKMVEPQKERDKE